MQAPNPLPYCSPRDMPQRKVFCEEHNRVMAFRLGANLTDCSVRELKIKGDMARLPDMHGMCHILDIMTQFEHP